MTRYGALAKVLDEGLLWMIVMCIGWCLGLVLLLVVACGANCVFPEAIGVAISGGVMGALIGFVQWQFLRLPVKRAGLWVLATALGWLGGVAATAIVIGLNDGAYISSSRIGSLSLDPTAAAIIGALAGGWIFACAQWLVLRLDTTPRLHWAAITVVGWTVAVTLGITLVEPAPESLAAAIMEVAASGAIGLVVLALVALVVHVGLFRESQHDAGDFVRWWPWFFTEF
jgi:hypothetical protein